jgi:hypothetical protein
MKFSKAKTIMVVLQRDIIVAASQAHFMALHRNQPTGSHAFVIFKVDV